MNNIEKLNRSGPKMNAVLKMFDRKCCIENGVAEMLDRNAEPKMLYWKCGIRNVASKMLY
jgi:hypothetical protein